MSLRTWRGPAALLGIAAPALALPQAAPRPDPYAVRDVRIERAADGRRATLVLSDGRVDAVLDPSAPLPTGVRVIEGAELLALPAFVDAFTRAGAETPEPTIDRDLPVDVREDVGVDMRHANRKGIQPAFRAVDRLALDPATRAAWNDAGFGALCSSPSGELLAGASVLALVREAATRDVVLVPEVHAHAAFDASGPGYPSTLMGYHAQLRQFFLDVERHAELVRRFEAGRPGPRPPHDPDLEAALPLLAGDETLVCEAESARDVRRWLDLSEELGVRIALAGGREAGLCAEILAERGVPVVLTLDWGDEVPDPAEEDEKRARKGRAGDDEDEAWTYVEPFAVRAERRREWEERRDTALRLHEAGVAFAFGTAESKPKELLERVRTLVEVGLPADVALAALTSRAAELCDAGDRLGRIAPGADATLCLWTGDPLTDAKAEPRWVFVDGFATEREIEEAPPAGAGPAEGVDASGAWTLAVEGEDAPEAVRLELVMEEDGAVAGACTVTLPTGATLEADLEGSVSGTALELKGEVELEGEPAPFRLTGTLEGDALEGEIEIDLPFEEDVVLHPFTGAREPDARGGAR